MKKNKRVLVSCGTKFHADYMAGQLARHGLLEQVVTAHPPSRFLNRVQLNRKQVKFLPPFFTLNHFLSKAGLQQTALGRYLNYHLPVWYDRVASRFIGKANVSISWAWAGLETIRKIKSRHGVAVVEECGSCNRYQNLILGEEYNTLGLPFITRTPEFIVEREMEEVREADYVLCPSRYVANSFINNGIAGEKCIVIPYGANVDLFKPEFREKKEFTILFVGTIGVRKGLIYLLKALEILAAKYPVKCLLIGTIEAGFEPLMAPYRHLFTHIARVPHTELPGYYNQASVFVFPSLDEGMAYVQLEAMACGLPVICTFNSGGDAVVTENENGHVIPIRDVGAITTHVAALYLDPTRCAEMGRNAAQRARAFTWSSYGDKLAAFIQSV